MEEYLVNPEHKFVILRHDVDERPYNALRLAEIENSLGIKSTYYFRIVKISNVHIVIQRIAELGHEIGYHYEDVSLCYGKLDMASKSFSENLTYFRNYYPVKTVCMHGSSFSDYDNRILWQYYSLKDFDLIGEPYLSIDYSQVFYITDTARRWDAGRLSVRDKVDNNFNLSFHTTNDIIKAVSENRFPEKSIIQSHTLWTNNLSEWVWLEFRELLRNRLKIIFQKIPFLKKLAYKITQKVSN